jgi:DMSO/TMAO reductase YedYZ heme-binding membrane subunit
VALESALKDLMAKKNLMACREMYGILEEHFIFCHILTYNIRALDFPKKCDVR